MILNKGQKEAIKRAIEWYYGDVDNSYMVISGAAGTGKSSTVKYLVEILDLKVYEVLFVAMTGKASLVLRRKGNIAYTVHKAFYNVYKTPNGKFGFKLKNSLPSIIKLVVVDECSMLNDKMVEDILSLNKKTIFLGDPYQLPPIFGQNTKLINPRDIDYELTDIMRQENDSKILTLANMAKNGEFIKVGKYGNCNVIFMKDLKKIEKYDVILTYRNETRRKFNSVVRKIKKINSIYPIKGEKLVGLKNNYYHQLDFEDISIFPTNGLTCIALNNAKIHDKTTFRLKYIPDFFNNDSKYFDTLCKRHYFDAYSTNTVIKDENSEKNDENEIVDLDFSYALSIHRSQGSEYNKVLIIDDMVGISKDLYRKALYTAITRSITSIDLVYGYLE
jgi:exodeoxyribonuclease-5